MNSGQEADQGTSTGLITRAFAQSEPRPTDPLRPSPPGLDYMPRCLRTGLTVESDSAVGVILLKHPAHPIQAKPAVGAVTADAQLTRFGLCYPLWSSRSGIRRTSSKLSKSSSGDTIASRS